MNITDISIKEEYYKRGDEPWMESGYETLVTIDDINLPRGQVKFTEHKTGDRITRFASNFLKEYLPVPKNVLRPPLLTIDDFQREWSDGSMVSAFTIIPIIITVVAIIGMFLIIAVV